MKIKEDNKIWIEYTLEGEAINIYLKEPKQWNRNNYIMAHPINNVIDLLNDNNIVINKEKFSKLIKSYQDEISRLYSDLMEARGLINDK